MLTPTEERILRKKLQDYNGKVEHLFLNAQGQVCVGIAHVLGSPEEALDLSFTNKNGLKASSEEIRADYDAVRQLAPNRIASFYKRHLKLTLPSSEVTRLTNQSLAQFYTDLTQMYEEFDSFPSDAKLALFDIIFGMGASDLADWITFNESIRAQNWQRAALDSARPFPVTAVRNIYVQGLFEKAFRSSKEPDALLCS